MPPANRWVALAVALMAGCDSAPPPASVPSDLAACHYAVVASDFSSSSVSLLSDTGALCVDRVIDSGARPPGLATALSGDVALPSSCTTHGFVLIDRQAGVLSVLDRSTGEVNKQIVVADFASNPYDVAFVAPDAWLVAPQ